MEVLQDGVLAFLAATGAAALFWLLTGWLRRREPARAVLLVPARGSGDFSGPVAPAGPAAAAAGPAAHRDLRLRIG